MKSRTEAARNWIQRRGKNGEKQKHPRTGLLYWPEIIFKKWQTFTGSQRYNFCSPSSLQGPSSSTEQWFGELHEFSKSSSRLALNSFVSPRWQNVQIKIKLVRVYRIFWSEFCYLDDPKKLIFRLSRFNVQIEKFRARITFNFNRTRRKSLQKAYQ